MEFGYYILPAAGTSPSSLEIDEVNLQRPQSGRKHYSLIPLTAHHPQSIISTTAEFGYAKLQRSLRERTGKCWNWQTGVT